MKIVFDTNIVHKDFFLRNAQIISLCETAKKCGIQVWIPQVVVDEIITHYKEKIGEARSDLQKAKYSLAFFYPNEGIKDYFTSEKEALLLDDYRSAFLERLSELGIRIIPYPQIPHEVLVRRDLARKKPFQSNGKGYRDALIWESVYNIIENNGNMPDLVFINKNTKDFFENGNLHPDLLADILSKGLPPDCMLIHEDISKAINRHIKPRQESLEILMKQYAAKDCIGEIDIKSYCCDKIETGIISGDYKSRIQFFQSGPGQFMEDASLWKILASSYKISDIRLLNDAQIIVDVDGVLDILYGGKLHKTSAFLIDKKDMPNIFDDNWDEHYMYVRDILKLPVSISLIIDKDLKSVYSHSVTFL